MIEPKFSLGLPADAQRIREKVFMEEQGFKNEIIPGDDEGAWCLVLYLNGTPIATGRIKEEDPETFHIGRVAVLKEYRGKKVGTYLLKFLETKIMELGGRKAVLGAQIDKKGFYEKCGYASEGEIFYDEGHPHIHMSKTLERRKLYRHFYKK